ncbi:hypothetical protein CLAFUW4_10768 [Fulvia fulva]|uniref:Uncharacterized protein n=1 Tax=Passalora fulva TaxID=5499 RepID=A0A9Q8P7U2_PASFU|nr:uncharacterized protein CLAFUR5_05380 [Fulvia fulva]KAK4615476.1 hypothetical protein CLAFUR4_10773 [Fulvia fulva]KAK4617280.1 hypothetical protein CLAFUR0_10780 [Fulvia fulva]UJO16515.1 hypothetical protein CLAFUR5_05380 [Fulvia fulva]WPV18757.1 hypothetical protein CLAFUW4_10768 [Fulvia fulva]WPV34287.1 hypothetical protein CLAFUW7_10770 [Fulvia fulva]
MTVEIVLDCDQQIRRKNSAPEPFRSSGYMEFPPAPKDDLTRADQRDFHDAGGHYKAYSDTVYSTIVIRCYSQPPL